ncbi:MAG: DUF2341 domain-containing protein [Bryobacteraceae bacterium]
MVAWSISPAGAGAINQTGLYEAPALITGQQTVTVTAAIQGSNGVTATATVVLIPVSVSVSPATSTLVGSQTEQFTATVANGSPTAVKWSVQPAGAGTVDATGFYTAPATVTAQQTATVIATSQADPTKSASATVTLLPSAAPCLSASFPYERAITIDHTKVPNTDQTNFPLLISLTDPSLATVANGGHVANTNGYDIVFASDPAGATRLDHEIESYDPKSGQVIMWVRIPTLSATSDTIIYMLYGTSAITTSQENKTGVWASSYAGVWHLDSYGQFSQNDSTINGNNGSLPAGSPKKVSGQIGVGASFSNNSYIDVSNPQGMPVGSSTWTFTGWFTKNSSSDSGLLFDYGEYTWGLYATNLSDISSVLDITGADNVDMSVTLVPSQWYYVASTFDGTSVSLYLNGQLLGSEPATPNIQPGDLFFGQSFNGSLDELRIANVALSADWIAAEYNNQYSPATFFRISSENLSISPVSATLSYSQVQKFTAAFMGGCTESVAWSTTPAGVGVVDQTGLYTAPALIPTQQTITVTATIQGSTAEPVSAGVVLMPLSVGITPANPILYGGQTQQFAASVINAIDTSVTWTISPANVGAIDPTGLYTAPSPITAQQNVIVTATSAHDLSKSASTTILLMPGLRTCVQSGHAFQRAIVIDHTKVPNTDQTNFPLLVSLTDPLLATVANGGHVTSANGYDIIFTADAAGANKLDHEIEFYDPAGQIVMWVRIPTLSHIADTVIYLNYGDDSILASQENKTGVWDSAFTAVYHFGASGSTLSANDSTANGNNGSVNNATPTLGEIDGAASFDGSSSFISLPDAAFNYSFNSPTTAYNLSFDTWFNTSYGGVILGQQGGSDTLPFGWSSSFVPALLVDASGYLRASFFAHQNVYEAQNQIVPQQAYNDGNWHHVVDTYTNGNEVLYVDGTAVGAQSGPQYSYAASYLYLLGAGAVSGGWGWSLFGGTIDEVRVSSIARSADWIATEYNNQHSPSTFYTVYGENLPVTPPSVTLYASGSVQLSATLGNCSANVAWSISPTGVGTMTSMGLYTAPATISTQQVVTATGSVQGNSPQSGQATITLLPLPTITANPSTVTLHGGQSLQFTANANGTTIPAEWSLTSGAGSMTSSGLYTAPAVIYTAQTVTVTAVAEGTQVTATITLLPAVTISITPPSITLGPSQAQEFSAAVLGAWNTGVTWTVSPANMGTISSTGIYTAPNVVSSSSNVTITATSVVDATVSASATVTLAPIVAGAPISVTPSAVTLSASQIQQFQALINGNASTAVTWSIGPTDPGTINSAGLYAAPADISFPQTATVTAITVGGSNQSAIATITLTPSTATGYQYRRPIVIDHTKVPNTDQANFPVLISGTYSYLASVANGGKVQNANGYDIVFDSDCTGDEKLDHEIESYNSQTGQVSMWVRIPYVSHTNDTVFYMSYGNSAITTSQGNKTGVWNSNYQMVLHLSESAAPYLDSTSNAFSSTGGVFPTPVTGKIGGAQSFDGVAQYIAYSQAQSPSPTSSISMEAWIKTTETAVKGVFGKWMSDGELSADQSYLMFYRAGGYPSGLLNSVGNTPVEADAAPRINDGNWHHLAVSAPSTGAISVYVDGVLSGNLNNAQALLTSTPDRLLIGATSLATGGWYMNGSIDEIRISNSARSADWIAAEYNSQNSPSTFYTIYPENSTLITPANTSLTNSQTQQFTAIFTSNASANAVSPLTLLGAVQTPSSAHSIAVNGNLAYLCDDNEVSIIDATTPSQPVLAGTALSNSIANDGYAFCAIQRNSLVGFVDATNNSIGNNPSFVAFDLSSPVQPQLIAGTPVNKRFFSNTPEYLGNTAFLSTYAYSFSFGMWTTQYGDIVAVGISDFSNPSVVGTLSTGGDSAYGGPNPVMGVTVLNPYFHFEL